MTKDILYISHGGGPLPLLGDPGHQELVENLKQIASEIRRPSAILVISAHWEESVATVTTGANPPLIYDYSGFPEESYSIQYPSPGHPELAAKVVAALDSEGLPVRKNAERGFDHGHFVPLKIMYPEADIPCIQLSLVNSLDAKTHLAIGKALQSLEHENLLVLGSGFSFHNMRAFFTPDTPETLQRNQAFEDWLKDTCINPKLLDNERETRLAEWEEAPHARYCHPREEHLLPLHVCCAMAGKSADWHRSARVLGKNAGLFYWSE